ncbi:hypothetical protein GGX14DRAFT_653014 [Mycena pura]|uniref:Probable RNA polymerase II nuclear localization protein SLC7A6OS n=1 Tax=Mycena pura TaxID=153505 RepID=A0AAD6VC17_9AGAR|nr:hypothetical protein GGX14DRAFT_653014 [Mycena pura]
MDNVGGPVAQSYTILRIKRKRNEEPLDALVVESRRRKRSRGGAGGVFRFAQTVEHDAWTDEAKKRDIQDQISRLAREKALLSPASAATEPVPSTSAPLRQTQATPPVPKDDPNRRYKIILQEEEAPPPRRRFPSSPPKVISAKDRALKAEDTNNGFKMYDAVLSAEAASTAAADEQMERFMPMLNDYLKLHDLTPDPLVAEPPPASKSSADDYVWDVFYHRPTTLTEWNEIANVGTLTGLPPSITDPYDSTSDSEEEDEADEDSNAEEYYKNDYPDEEESSESDAFSDDSADGYNNDDSEHDWR